MSKTSQKNTYELRLRQLLTSMDRLRIKTKEDLHGQKSIVWKVYMNWKAYMKTSDLMEYTDLNETFWKTLSGFINEVALKSKNTVVNGKRADGNTNRLRELQNMGADLEDVRQNVLLHTIKYLDYALAVPLEAQVPYFYKAVNSGVVNEYRRLRKNSCSVSLQDVCKSDKKKADSKDLTFEDTITDNSTAEDWIMAKETVYELLNEKRYQKCCEKQEILEDLNLLRTPEQAFVYFCMYDQMRPRHIYEQYIAMGNATYLVVAICKKYGITAKELPTVVNKPLSNKFTAILRTHDEKAICNKISDIKYGFPASVKERLNARMKASGAKKAMKK